MNRKGLDVYWRISFIADQMINVGLPRSDALWGRKTGKTAAIWAVFFLHNAIDDVNETCSPIITL